jgi:hypothetical protein
MGLIPHLNRWEEKAKCQKMNVNSRGGKSLEVSLYYNDSQHNTHALQGMANKMNVINV